MHRRLLDEAIRKAWMWVIAIVLVSAIAPAGILAASTDSVVLFVVLYVFFVAAPFVASLLPYPFRPRLQHIKCESRHADRAITERVAGVCVALGQPPVDVVELNHPSVNVGLVDNNGRPTLVLTSGALAQLTKPEIESVAATQLAIAASKSLAPLVRIVGWMKLWPICLCLPVLAFSPLFIFVLPIAALAFWAAPLPFLLPRVLWWLRVAYDGVCIETTRFPKPLPNALCKIALSNGVRLPTRFVNAFGVADLAWMAPISANSRMETWIGEKKVAVSTDEMVSDLRLLLSAKLVNDVCLNGQPPTVDSWRSARAAIRDVERKMAEGVPEVAIGDYVVDLNGLRRKAD